MSEGLITANDNVVSTAGSVNNPLKSIISSMITKKNEIIGEIATIKTDMSEMKTGASDPSDAATNNELFAAKRDRREKLGIRLQKIEVALQQYDDGEFGICIRCDEEISIKRLEALQCNPSPLCIDCKDIVERDEKKGEKRT